MAKIFRRGSSLDATNGLDSREASGARYPKRNYALTRITRGALCCLFVVMPLLAFKSKPDSVVPTPIVSTQMPQGVWQPIAMPNDDQYDLADFSAVDGWALGAHHLAHWDGERWTSYPAPDGYDKQNPISVKVLSPRDAWILEVGGVMFHWDGYHWTQSLLPVSKDSHDEPEFMAFVSPTQGWVVGGGERQANLYGLIFEWNGREWTRKEIPDMGGFWGIDVVTPTDGWMAESSSYLWHWNGKEWQRYNAQTFSDDFVSFAMASSSDGWMERYNSLQIATLWHWDGTRWREFQELQPAYYSLALANSDFGWAVGHDIRKEKNILMHWDGQAWSEYPIEADGPLYYVVANSTEDGWIWGGDSWDLSKIDSGKEVVFRYRLVSAAAPTVSATGSASPTASSTKQAPPSATAPPIPPTSTRVTLTPTPPPLISTPPPASATSTPTPLPMTTRSTQYLPLLVVLVVLLIVAGGGVVIVAFRRRRR